MPQLPSTGISTVEFDQDAAAGDPLVSHLALRTSSSGPTPDPDLDDVVLISPDTAGVIASLSSATDPPPAPIRSSLGPPRVDLSDITLHSPSSIIGTPFDFSSPRFEYPFPATTSDSDSIFTSSLPSTMSAHYSNFQASISSSMLHFPPPGAGFPRSEVRSHSPAHPKLQAHTREPPIPPSLAKKKRLSLGLNNSERSRSETRRRSSNTLASLDQSVRAPKSRTSNSEVPNREARSLAQSITPLEHTPSDNESQPPSSSLEEPGVSATSHTYTVASESAELQHIDGSTSSPLPPDDDGSTHKSS